MVVPMYINNDTGLEFKTGPVRDEFISVRDFDDPNKAEEHDSLYAPIVATRIPRGDPRTQPWDGANNRHTFHQAYAQFTKSHSLHYLTEGIVVGQLNKEDTERLQSLVLLNHEPYPVEAAAAQAEPAAVQTAIPSPARGTNTRNPNRFDLLGDSSPP